MCMQAYSGLHETKYNVGQLEDKKSGGVTAQRDLHKYLLNVYIQGLGRSHSRSAIF